MHLCAFSRSRVASETANDRQARLQRLRSCVRRLQESGAFSGSPHNALHSLVITRNLYYVTCTTCYSFELATTVIVVQSVQIICDQQDYDKHN